MVMRVGGIVSGMDIEAMVKKLMEAERMPLDRMKQQQTILEWKRDAFREINSTFLELDNMMLDMKMSYTYKPKSANSSNESAITAIANSNAPNGSYDIEVTQLAKNEMQIASVNLDANLENFIGEHEFITYDKAGEEQRHTFEVREGDTLQQVLKRITDDTGNNVRAFFDESTNQVVFETSRTGIYNTQDKNDGSEIYFGSENNEFFTTFLNFDPSKKSSAENATFCPRNTGRDEPTPFR